MDKYKIKNYTERLKKETTKNAHKMLYMWIKQDIITLNEYQELVKNCSIPNVMQSCDTCKHLSTCRFWQEAPNNGATCKFYIEHVT